MKKQLKMAVLGLSVMVGMTLGYQTVLADVIYAPDPANNITQVDKGNVLKEYKKKSLNVIDNQTVKGNMDRKYNEHTLTPDSPSTVDNYQTTADSSAQTNLATQFFLPDGFNVTGYQHGNFQNVTLDDQGNVYFIESNGSETNLGVIVEYNLQKLQQLGVGKDTMALWRAFNYFNPYTNEGLAHNQDYENAFNEMKQPKLKIKALNAKLGVVSDKHDKRVIKLAIAKAEKKIKAIKQENSELFKNEKIAAAAQISQQIDIGHGQTLSFNPQNQHLYIVKDNTLTDLENQSENNDVIEMNTDNLKPIREYNFKMFYGDSDNYQLHTLTFDKQGNAYWCRKTGLGMMFFFGRLDKHDVQFQAAPSYLKSRGGSPNQGISYNAKNDRLYFVSDDILTSIPTQEVRDGSISPSDIHYYGFTSKRECESLSFDQDGYGYLLMLWPAELVKSSTPLN
ncbi:hypothetical protein [Lentilactobacillus sp. Marseille-Q4993]|uniref:hypothetical protein n=1 Tax=Lentilactobacillus sp. Marseille-Q4993 TaxID=3039492 RepID=UPI0024BCB8DC|nr:hypothetical protein [Lentilactobacillus sp. Marseille-Q4993]